MELYTLILKRMLMTIWIKIVKKVLNKKKKRRKGRKRRRRGKEETLKLELSEDLLQNESNYDSVRVVARDNK